MKIINGTTAAIAGKYLIFKTQGSTQEPNCCCIITHFPSFAKDIMPSEKSKNKRLIQPAKM
jgi:hypothetical protein